MEVSISLMLRPLYLQKKSPATNLTGDGVSPRSKLDFGVGGGEEAFKFVIDETQVLMGLFLFRVAVSRSLLDSTISLRRMDEIQSRIFTGVGINEIWLWACTRQINHFLRM